MTENQIPFLLPTPRPPVFLSYSLALELILGMVDGPASYIRVSHGQLWNLNLHKYLFLFSPVNRDNQISSTDLLTSLPVKCKMDVISITDDQEMIISYF